jgi:hypothetical protein
LHKVKIKMSAFGTDDFPPPSLEEQRRMQEMAARELQYNIKELQDSRKNRPQETPCQTFYKLKKGIPLSLFIRVYPFNELVDCGSNFQLEELKELDRLYSMFEESDQQFYIDSFRRLQQMITSIQSNKIPGSYGKGFQPWKEEVAANQEVQDVLRNPEPSDREIDEIAYQNYMQTRIPAPPAAPPVPSLFGRVKNLFGLGGGRKTSKKMYQKRSKSRSKKSNSHSKKSRSKSRSKK